MINKRHSIKNTATIQWLDQLTTLIEAEVPLLEALRHLAVTDRRPEVRGLMQHLIAEVQLGGSLGASLRTSSVAYPTAMAALIEAGERSGTLAQVLKHLVHDLRQRHELTQAVMQALSYPAVVLCVALMVTVALLLWVVPQFQSLFLSFGAPLPTATQMIIHLADGVRSHGLMLILVVGLIYAWIAWHAFHQTRHWQTLQRALTHLPIVGVLQHQRLCAATARLLATLLNAGIPLTTALELSAQSTAHALHKSALITTHALIKEGASLSTSLSQAEAFDRTVIHLVGIGEQSGQLANMLGKAASILQQSVNMRIKQLSNLLEPFMMVAIGLFMGGLLIALYLPIFSMSTVMM